MHVCASPLMRCQPLALPHRPTAPLQPPAASPSLHMRFPFFADYCWHCAPVCRRFRKSYHPSRLTLSALRSSIYYIRCTNGTCVLQIPALKAIGTSPVPGNLALSPGPPLSQMKMSMITCPHRARWRQLPARK